MGNPLRAQKSVGQVFGIEHLSS